MSWAYNCGNDALYIVSAGYIQTVIITEDTCELYVRNIPKSLCNLYYSFFFFGFFQPYVKGLKNAIEIDQRA